MECLYSASQYRRIAGNLFNGNAIQTKLLNELLGTSSAVDSYSLLMQIFYEWLKAILIKNRNQSGANCFLHEIQVLAFLI
jgi:hypothetical protein